MEQDDEVEEEVLEQDYPNVTLFILLKLPLDDDDVNRIQEFIFYAHTHTPDCTVKSSSIYFLHTQNAH